MYFATCSVPWTLDATGNLVCSGTVANTTGLLPSLSVTDAGTLLSAIALALVVAWAFRKLRRLL